MPNRIETAASGRAGCRGCKGTIAKGSLRFAEEVANPYSENNESAFRFWHLGCAAETLANELAVALAAFPGEVPDRAALVAAIEEHLRPEMPFAERAGSGRARCRACDAAIKKGELRVAFERMYDSPMGPQKGAAYAHPGCVPRYLEREVERGRHAMDRQEAVKLVLDHCRLDAEDLDALRRALGVT